MAVIIKIIWDNRFAKKLLLFISLLLLTSFFVFTLFNHLPGDASELLLGIHGTEQTLANLRQELGLNQTFWQGYFSWIKQILQGDLGNSIIYQTPISELLANKIPISLTLAVSSLLLSNMIAVPLGLWMAWHRYNQKYPTLEKSLHMMLFVFLAIPSFWCAMLLTLLFAIHWQILPAGGINSPIIKSFILPSIVLALPQIAISARFTHIQTLNILKQPFILTALCKGCSQLQILWHHLLKNIAAPLLTLSALQFAFLFSGTIVVENIFFLPGMGHFAVQSLLKRDITSLQIIFLFFILLLLGLNFISDYLRQIIDPRPSFDKE